MTVERCPTCQQPIRPVKITKPMRICADCGDFIDRTHRYTFQERDDNTVPVTVHRSCEYPQGYFDLGICKARRIAPYSCYSTQEIEAIEATTRKRCAERGWECSLDG